MPWACPHGTPKRGTERELSGLERSEHKRKTIKVLRALRVAPREGRASLGTEGSVEPGGPSVTTPGETLDAAFRSVELFSQLIERPFSWLRGMNPCAYRPLLQLIKSFI